VIRIAVTEKTAVATMSLTTSAVNNLKRMIFTPVAFFTKPTFAAVCIVYGGTYVAANSIMSYCEMNDMDSYWPKLLGTTVVNMALGITKDRYFAKVFNKSAPPVFPAVSWGLFFFRDLLTIGAGFNFPAKASTFLQDTKIIPTKSTADTFSQVTVPMAAQMVLTPIHVLALDMYNRVGQTTLNRFQYIKNIYPETVSIRMGRVLCAYGIAGVTNKNIRQILRDKYL
jgi:hypothetical protein